MKRILAVTFIFSLIAASCKSGDSGNQDAGTQPGQEETNNEGEGGDKKSGQEKPSVLSVTSIESEVTAPAGSLALNLVSLRPSGDGSGGLSLKLASGTEFEEFKASEFVWDPAQEPIKAMNSVLCMIRDTKFNLMANKGTYVAKVRAKDCFRNNGEQQGGGQGGSSDNTPTDITVDSKKESKKALESKFWFEIEESKFGGGEVGTAAAPGGGNEPTIMVYAHLLVAAPPSEENIFGIFRLRWQGYRIENGTQDSSPSIQGYVEVSRDPESRKSVLSFRESNTRVDEWTWDNGGSDVTETWTNIITKQAISEIDVKDGKASRGISKTSTDYDWSFTTTDTSATGGGYSATDDSGYYLTGFDRETKRAATKYVPSAENTAGQSWYAEGSSDFRCEELGNERQLVFSYVPFKSDGSRLEHATGYSVETDRPDVWPGWIDQWGFYPPEGTTDGETLYIVNFATGSRTAKTFKKFNGLLKNDEFQDITTSQGTNLTLECSSGCPIESSAITQAQIDGNTHIEDPVSPVTYVFDVATKELKRNGTVIGYHSEVTDNWLTVNLTDPVSTKSYTYEMIVNPWNIQGGLHDGSNNYFQAPESIQFNDRAYDHAQDALDSNMGASKDGDLLSTLFWGQPQFDGWSLNCCNWEALTGVKDQWGGDLYAPVVTLKKGFTLEAANTTGDVSSGDTIKFAPGFVEKRANIKSDCSQKLTDDVDAADTWALPEALTESDADIKSKIGSQPSTTTNGVSVVNGELVE